MFLETQSPQASKFKKKERKAGLEASCEALALQTLQITIH